MESAAAWFPLAVGILLWTLGSGVPVQVSLPYAPQTKGKCQETEKEYYNDVIQMCCSKCPPGQRVLHSCTADSNTICTNCEDDTHTEVWNWVKECHGCRSRCNRGLVEIQNCTRRENRVCACKPGFFCIMKSQDTCLRCSNFTKCFQGYGVSKPGTQNTNVRCTPCAPGTFSDTISSTDICKPHRVCQSVAVPGNATSDAICKDVLSTPTKAPGVPLSKHHPESMNPKNTMWSSPPNIIVDTSPQPQPQPTIHPVVSSNPVYPHGWILGLMVFSMLLIILISIIMWSQRKSKFLSCIKEETKVPLSAPEKSQNFLGHTRTEQQNLLESEATSSSNSLDSMLSSGEAKEAKGMENNPHQASSSEKSKCGQGTRAGSMNSDHSHGGGTQVNVTCIVKVCNSDHTSQCSSQSSCSSGSPWKEDIPFSQEESPRGEPKPSSQSALENLLPDLEEKQFPMGIQDMGMKLS